MVCCFGALAAIVATLARLVERVPFVAIGVMLLVLASICVLLFVGNRYNLYRVGTVITLITLCDILFPLIFFTNGGMDSGMAAYFVLSIVIIFLLEKGRNRVILLCVHVLIVLASYYISLRYPGLLFEMTSFQRSVDHIQSILVSGFFIGFVIVFQNRMYLTEKRKVEEAGKELLKQENLLHAVNSAAELLLSDAGRQAETLRESMKMMALCSDIDRVYIWKNHEKEGELYYAQILEWVGDESLRQDALMEFAYQDTLSGWEDTLRKGQCVNGPLDGLTHIEWNNLASYGIRSILVVPVFLQEGFWGFVSFDDCHSARTFSKDEESILRSGSLLLVNALVRSTDAEAINRRLKQQELMSRISQSFISKTPMATLINGALRQMGEFLGVTRVLIAVADKDSEESHPVYTWFSLDSWKPDPSTVGFNEIISTSFPKHMPQEGFVPAIYCNDTHNDADGKYQIFEIVDLKAFVWAPLYLDGEYWGMLSVEECISKRVWSESDAQLVGMVSSAIAGAVARDLMEEERSAALNQAVQASKAKGDFLSNMSHEMRTPMNAIIGMTSIGQSAQDIERKDYCFGKIEDASTHLLGVINDILDMSKIEADKLELSAVNFNFEKMLQRVVNVINFRVGEKQQKFTVHIDRRIPPTLLGDDQRLAQVITNLLSNAVKFTPNQGTIHLEARHIEEKDDICTLQMEVTDNGIGISAEQQSRLFNSFQQADSSTSRNFGGTGLGLAISKRIVEMMGGEIWVESEAGKGSTFAFTIQAKRAAAEYHSRLAPGVNWGNIRVLAVDDEPDVQMYFKEIAQRFGIACDIAGSGEDAIALIRENGAYDLYFVDWKMPGMDGIELSKRIKEQDQMNSVVTMISATEWSVIENDAKNAGVDRFLPKPLFPSAFADLINECLGVGHAVREEEPLAEADDFGSCRVLLAEDVDINREILLALLEPTRLMIDCAENGAEALRKYREAPDAYDMIFMDVQMPEMDGYEATRQIRALDVPGAKSIPIIAMTANVFREDIEKCLEVGMDDHVGKPLDLDEVLARLRKYLPNRGAGGGLRPEKTGAPDDAAAANNANESDDWKYGIAWDPELETGNHEIDRQHKQLFRLTSDLVDACAKGQSPAVLSKALDFLAAYTVEHFADEEALQLKYHYPDYEAHKKLHDDFSKTATDLVAQYKAEGSSDVLVERVNAIVVRWLVKHIGQEDSKIAAHIRKQDG
jgi:hemerythrin-like metal-binding protein